MASRVVPSHPTEIDPVCAEPHSADPAALSDVRSRLLGGRSVEAIADVFKLLGDPTRVRLVDALTTHRIAYAQTFRDEMRDLSAILNPVQRGQYLMMRDRLMQRVQELQQGRTDPPPAAPFRPNRRP